MAKKTKKTPKVKASEAFEVPPVVPTEGSAGPTESWVPSAWTIPEKKKLTPISIDFGNEHLNNLGNKVNEIIEYLNAI